MSDPLVARVGDLLGEREIRDRSAMERLGERLGRILIAGDVVVLVGELGAGKTTLTRGIGRAVGVRDSITSPTFVVARTHKRAAGDGPELIHVDAYRLASADEFDDLDLDADHSIVVIEWGEGLADRLADEWLLVRISRPSGAVAGVALDQDDPRLVVLEVAHAARLDG